MAMELQGGGIVVMGPIETDVITRSTQNKRRPEWIDVDPGAYECCVHITKEDDGFSINMPSLPGVVSEGDTEEEAIANIKEAFQGVMESYRKHNEQIPWVQIPEPRGGKTNKFKKLWIVAHA